MASSATERLFRLLKPVAEVFTWPLATVTGFDRSTLRSTVDYEPAATGLTPLSAEQTNGFLKQAIERGGPSLLARCGSTELRVVLRHHGRHSRHWLQKLYAAIARLEAPIWTPWEHRNIRVKSGFYPVTKKHVDQFVQVMTDSLEQLDLLASWIPGENKLRHHFPSADITTLRHLYTLRQADLWTKSLAGKKVLVIHPFEQSIRSQFEKKHLLFSDPGLLPDFELKTLKAVQSLGTPPPEFPTWFDGLHFMHQKAREMDYDVALIAAGAYGLPLGSRLKGDGKTVLVLGGFLQLLFGIKGKRWDSSGLYNEHWVRPLDSERPDGFKGADGGAYW